MSQFTYSNHNIRCVAECVILVVNNINSGQSYNVVVSSYL